ncbi:MAG: tetratricopeptide repeat protein [Planctomycetaceae bacterium]|nr:tetratricopeptide repeat protein [Planctomycetaceae bacterium]
MADSEPTTPKKQHLHTAALVIAGALMCAVGVGVGRMLTAPASLNGEEKPSTAKNITQTERSPAVDSPFDVATTSLDSETVSAEGTPTGVAALFGLDPDAPLPNSEPGETAVDGVMAHVAQADEELRAGSYARALRIYEFALENVSGISEAAVRYRLALCAEANGKFAEAIQQYQQVIRQFPTLPWAGVARIGEARCLAAERRIETLTANLMRNVVLDETSYSVAVRGELLHVLGRGWCETFLSHDVRHLLKDDGLTLPLWMTDPNRQLNLLPELLNDSAPPAAAAVAFEIVQKTDSLPESIYLRVHTPPAELKALVKAVITRSGFQADLSEAARVIMGGRTQQLHNEDISLGALLDGLCTPFGLLWSVDDETIKVVSESEATAEQSRAFRQAVTVRLLNNALLTAPESPYAGYSRVSLGILQFQQKSFVESAHAFQSQLQLEPRSEIEVETALNLGKAFLALGQTEQARTAFLRAIDSPTYHLDARLAGYLYVGRLQIEEGLFQPAVSTLVRALAVCGESDMEHSVAVMLSSAYLMANSPQGANTILMERRDRLDESSSASAAAFLSSLARFRSAVLPDKREREGRSLVTALTRFNPREEFGAHWSYLHAEACSEVGLTPQAIDSYLNTLQQLPAAPLRSRAMLAVAQQYRADNRLEDAAALLSAIDSEEANVFHHLIRLQSAQVAVQQGRAQDALKLCRMVIEQSEDDAARREALQTMGHAYEQLKDYRSAVDCFAGMLPGETAPGSLPPQTQPEGALEDQVPFKTDSTRRTSQPAVIPVSGVRRTP